MGSENEVETEKERRLEQTAQGREILTNLEEVFLFESLCFGCFCQGLARSG